MNFKTRLFVILWIAGMAGILSFLFVDLSKLLASLPVPAGKQLPSSIWLLKLLSLIQPTVLLSLAVFVGVALVRRGQGKPPAIYFASAIVISSVVFGLGHLPIAFALSSVVTSSLLFYIIGANALFGVIAGYLYWKKGLESARIAHMLAHVVIVTVSYFGL